MTPMMNTILIVKPGHVLWNEYRDLRLEALRGEPQAFGSSYSNFLRKPDFYWQGRLDDAAEGKKSWLLFAKENDRLIGMVGASQSDDDIKDKVAQIISMFVTKNARGRGVATQLLAGMLHELENNTLVIRVKLAVNSDQAAAIRLYERFGFIIVGQRNSRQGDGKYHDEYLMELVMKSPESSSTAGHANPP